MACRRHSMNRPCLFSRNNSNTGVLPASGERTYEFQNSLFYLIGGLLKHICVLFYVVWGRRVSDGVSDELSATKKRSITQVEWRAIKWGKRDRRTMLREGQMLYSWNSVFLRNSIGGATRLVSVSFVSAFLAFSRAIENCNQKWPGIALPENAN